MNSAELKTKIKNGDIDGKLAELYISVDEAKTRYYGVCDKFGELYGDGETYLFSSPGRTEIGGNHTDHQHGCVLAASVDLDFIAAVSPNGTNTVNLTSEGYSPFSVDITDLSPNTEEYATPQSIVRGMYAAFVKDGYSVSGFDAYITSSVPKGAGLSSSAAMEVLIGEILNALYCEDKVSMVEIAKYAQRTECDFFGKPCGLMDQTACAVGGFTAIDFNNPATPVIEKVDFNIENHGYALAIINTGGSHADLTDDYAAVTRECADVSKYFGCGYLRDVSEEEFYRRLPELRGTVSDRAILRAMHFFAENSRAQKEAESIKYGKIDEFLSVVNASGNSSYKYLQNVYSITNVAEQGISVALALCERLLDGKGASRVHGGGFAGTVQAYVPADKVDFFKTETEKVFGDRNCFIVKIRPYGATKIM